MGRAESRHTEAERKKISSAIELKLLAGGQKNKKEEAPPGPAQLVHSSFDDATGLRTDTFVKPLGSLVPGEVMNTRYARGRKRGEKRRYEHTQKAVSLAWV